MRMHHIALLKTLCLVLVIFFHALLPFDGTNPFWRLNAAERIGFAPALGVFFWPVIIPSFVFASGFLWALGLERRERTRLEQVAGRVRRLLFPWLLMAVFWLAPLYTLFDLPVFNRPEGTSFADTLGLALTGRFVDHLWFLLVLFWASLFWIVNAPWLGRGRTIEGFALALAAALCIESYAGTIGWYCLGQSAAPVLCFYLGCAVCWHRERVDAWLCRGPLPVLGTLFLLQILLVPYTGGSAPAYWLACYAACFFSYLGSLLLARSVYPALRRLSWFRYFDDNAFRFYLFHMPTALVVFVYLYAALPVPPLVFVPLSFALTLALTACIVMASHRAQARLRLFLKDRHGLRKAASVLGLL